MFATELLSTLEAHSFATWALVFLTLTAAGAIKGTIGFGLPLVSISVLTNIIDVHLALAVMTLPIVTSNLWLGVQGGLFVATVRRFWWVVLAVGAGIFVGSWFMAGMDARALSLLVGLTIIVFALVEQFKPGRGFAIPESRVRPYGIAAGVVGGVMGGLSTAYGPPLILYLSALRMPKEVYIATIGVIWFFASIFLVVAFSSVRILTPHTAALSALAVLPVFVGMAVGKRVRGRIDAELFRRITLVALLLLGLNLVRRALI